MSNFFSYAGYGLSLKNLICVLSNFPRLRNFVAIKEVEVGSESFPLLKRGIEGDFFEDLQPSATLEISPVPSFPKRGNPNLPPQPTDKNKSVNLLGLVVLFLFFPGWVNLPKSRSEQERFSARPRRRFGPPRKDVSSKNTESRTLK